MESKGLKQVQDRSVEMGKHLFPYFKLSSSFSLTLNEISKFLDSETFLLRKCCQSASLFNFKGKKIFLNTSRIRSQSATSAVSFLNH